MTDVIGNFLTIIRNGILASKPAVEVPFSLMNQALAKILLEEGFVTEVAVVSHDGEQRIKIGLKYVDGESVIHEIRRASRPGRRFYASINDVKPVIGGLGLTILSTSKGVMSHKSARAANVGGEVLCTVW